MSLFSGTYKLTTSSTKWSGKLWTDKKNQSETTCPIPIWADGVEEEWSELGVGSPAYRSQLRNLLDFKDQKTEPSLAEESSPVLSSSVLLSTEDVDAEDSA